jgi:hypothetical protein
VTCIAHRLVDLGHVEASALKTISLVYPDSEADNERRLMAAVEQWCGIETVTWRHSGLPSFDEMLGHCVPVASYDGHGMNRPIRDSGHYLVLSGSLGDLFAQRPEHPILEALATRQLATYVKATVTAARNRNLPLLTLLLRPSRAWLRRARRVRKIETPGVVPDLLTKARARARVEIPPLTGFSRANRPLVAALYAFAHGGKLAVEEQWAPVWVTHPYVHRPLVEYLIAVPRLAMHDPTFHRIGMRRALTDILPSAILERTSKVGIPSTSYSRERRRSLSHALDRAPLTEMVGTWQLVRRGLVAETTLAAEIADVRRTPRPWPFLANCVHLEAWLRSLSATSNEAVRPPRAVARAPTQTSSTTMPMVGKLQD